MVKDRDLNEARLAAATAPAYAPGMRSFVGPSRAERRGTHGRRKIGREFQMSQARRRRDYEHVLKRLVESGQFGRMLDDPTFAKSVLSGAAEGYAGAGFPQAAGGVDVSAALTSVRPGIRKIKKKIMAVAISSTQKEIIIELPHSGYLEQPVIRIAGTIKVKQGGTAQAITMGDIRNLIQKMKFELSSTVVPKTLTGLQCDIIDNLDVAVVSANAGNKVPTSAELTGAANSTIEKPFVLELSPRLTVSDQNLYGIPYLGAVSTTPRIVIDLNNILSTSANGQTPLIAAAAGPEAELVNTVVTVDGWRIDLPAPVAPSSTTDSEGHTHEIPGEGLWAESGYLLKTGVIDSEESVGAFSEKPFRIPIGPMYTRLILLAYVGGILDSESGTAPQSILDHTELGVQDATVIESRYPWMFDRDYRVSYYKTRPSGVYVHSGIDQSGTDEDLWVTQDLGDFTLTAFASGNANGAAGTKFELLGQSLMPISRPGLYA